MQRHVVEHRSQSVIGIGARSRFFHGFRNRQPQGTLVIGIARQRIAAGLRHFRRAGEHFRAPGLHHRTAIRLLLIADFDHVDAHVETEHLPGQGH